VLALNKHFVVMVIIYYVEVTALSLNVAPSFGVGLLYSLYMQAFSLVN
jgi:hypothetical protein